MRNKNMKQVILIIDTSSNQEIKIGLRIDKKEYWIKRKLITKKSEIALQVIQELIKKQGIELNDLTQIEVNTGPGSFTGLKVGVSIANALSFALKIPVNNKSLGEIVEPEYK